MTTEGEHRRASGLSASELRSVESRVRRGFLWLASTTALWQLFSWGFTILTARILLPSDYGLLALSEAVFPYLLMVTTLKMETWLVQTERFDAIAQRSVLTLALALGTFTSLIAFLSADLLAAFYREPEAQLPFQISSVIFFLRAVQLVPEARLRRELNFKSLAVCNLVTGVSRAALQLLLAASGCGYWSLVVGGIFREIAVCAWLIASAGIPQQLGWDSRLNNAAVRFGLVATGSSVFWIVFSTADNIVVGRFLGREVLGYYTMAFFLAELPLGKLNTVLMPLLSPYYAKLRHNTGAVQRAFLRVNKGIVTIIAPALLGLSVVASELVPVLLDKDWMPMIAPLQVMGIVGLLRAVTANSNPLLFALGKERLVLAWSGLVALVLPACLVVAGREYGLNGMYLVWLVVYPLVGIGSLLLLLKIGAGISPRVFLVNLRGPVVSSCAMALICLFVGWALGPNSSREGVLVAKIVTGVASYMVVMYLLFRRDFLEGVAALRRLRG